MTNAEHVVMLSEMLAAYGEKGFTAERAALTAAITQLRTAASEGGEAVAYLHYVAGDDGEPDQALSFTADSFPLEGVAGYRKVSCQPLYAHPPTDSGAGRDGERWPTVDWLATKLCEARNHWCEHHEDDWLVTDENDPDEWIANFILHALATDCPAIAGAAGEKDHE